MAREMGEDSYQKLVCSKMYDGSVNFHADKGRAMRGMDEL
jgi:hypothetical protein